MPAASSPSYPESQKRNHTEPTAEEPGCCYDVAKRNKNKDTVTNEQARPASIDTSAVGEACGYIAVPLKFTRNRSRHSSEGMPATTRSNLRDQLPRASVAQADALQPRALTLLSGNAE